MPQDAVPLTRVVVHGASGRMGQEVIKAVCQETDLAVVGAVAADASGGLLSLPYGRGTVPYSTSLEQVLDSTKADVLVDFSIAEATVAAVPVAVRHGLHLVIGTTGLSPDNLAYIDKLCQSHGKGAVVASNFSLGAVIMVHLAKLAARFFDYAEIIEMHHHQKADAPSGTALATAKAMVEARHGKPFQAAVTQKENLKGTRGGEVDGVAIHSTRLPGVMACQEIIFGAPGQTLTIRHDTISRECYMPGLIRAIRDVGNRKGLLYGLDTLLGLQEAL